MSSRRLVFTFCILHFAFTATAQVVGGQYAFEYLRLPNAPHITALGGMNVADPDDDIAFALQNPALMRPGMHNELGLNYNNFYSGIGIANLNYGYNVDKIKTSFIFGVQYLNYGNFAWTDQLGNQFGNFQASEYAITIGASKQYLERWRYGADLKFASSTLFATNTAKAVLCDVGINYYDTANLIDFGATAKNMGVMIRDYTPGVHEPLPFDLQIGLSKQFKHMPLRLMVTLHHLYEWDIRYNDPNLITQTTIFGTSDTNKASSSGYFADKLFRHFIFGAELILGKRVIVTVSYNDLMRTELALQERTALTGISYGLNLYLNKFQVHLGHTNYYVGGGYNELGIVMALNKLMGIGKTGEHIHWNATYPEW